jgi:hypothetical protein
MDYDNQYDTWGTLGATLVSLGGPIIGIILFVWWLI